MLGQLGHRHSEDRECRRGPKANAEHSACPIRRFNYESARVQPSDADIRKRLAAVVCDQAITMIEVNDQLNHSVGKNPLVCVCDPAVKVRDAIHDARQMGRAIFRLRPAAERRVDSLRNHRAGADGLVVANASHAVSLRRL
jgi:hypothetical protein